MAILTPPMTDTLEARIAHLREELFVLVDQARASVPYECTALHVSLQAASNELGKAEQALPVD
jgi:hypothetical protein